MRTWAQRLQKAAKQIQISTKTRFRGEIQVLRRPREEKNSPQTPPKTGLEMQLPADPSRSRGEAVVEFILLTGVVLIPLAYLILTLAALQAAAFAAEASARDAAYLLSHDRAHANLAIQQMELNFATYLGDNSQPPQLHYHCEPSPCAPGSLLFVQVHTSVDLPLLPSALAGTLQAQIPVSAGYSLPIEGLVIRMNKRFPPEGGRITVLVIALTLLVLAVITVALLITSLHTQRRQLYACADALTLSAAQEIKGNDFYGAGEFHTLSADVEKIARQRLAALQTTACGVGEQVQITSVRVNGSELEVAVETVPTLPIVSRYMSFLTEPMKIRVASTVSVAISRSV